MRPLTLASPLVLVLALAASCGREPRQHPDAGPDSGVPPPPDDGGSFVLANWNVRYFGDTAMDPDAGALQQQNVTSILRDAGFDIAGLQEIVDAARLQAVVAALPGYDAILSSDGARVSGTSSCASFGDPLCYSPAEQKVALLYRTQVASVRSAQLILTGDSSLEYAFAYRPPLRVDLDLRLQDGGTEPIVVIVLHLKAYGDLASRDRRQISSAALKAYLDSTLPAEKVAVVGDWNDDLDFSTAGGTSPFQNFLDDPARYRFVTGVLTQGNIGTTGWGTPIDHQLVTDELLPWLRAGSVSVLHPAQWGDPDYSPESRYSTTTSDHWPVISRWQR